MTAVCALLPPGMYNTTLMHDRKQNYHKKQYVTYYENEREIK